MLSQKDKDQYFEVLMALGGYNNIPDKHNSSANDKGVKQNRGVLSDDSIGSYGSGTRTMPRTM